MASIKPQGNRILIKPKKASVSLGGILLPETAQEKPKEGIVMAVGPGELLESGQRRSVGVKVGDQVLFSSYAGHSVEHQKEEYLILSESDVLGVIEAGSCCGGRCK